MYINKCDDDILLILSKQSNMFYFRVILGLVFHVILALEEQTETITDLYNKINTYGSLLKATSFDVETQSKLKYTNTVRMVSYQGLFFLTSFYLF